MGASSFERRSYGSVSRTSRGVIGIHTGKYQLRSFRNGVFAPLYVYLRTC